MALRKCKECGNNVSSKATSCPSCGAPTKKRTSAATGCLVIVAAGVFIVVCAGLLNSNSEPSSPATKPIRSTPSTTPPNYTVHVEQAGELTVCQVTFRNVPEEASAAAKIVRNAVESLVKENANREILAMAFNEAGAALPDIQYGGALSYKPSDGKILTMDERSGKQTIEMDEDAYFVKLEESRTAQGITPIRRWLDVSIVFPDEPNNGEVKPAVQHEINKLKARELDVNVYVFVGDKSNPGSWKQVKASNGKYMSIDYVEKTGRTVANWNWDSPSTSPR